MADQRQNSAAWLTVSNWQVNFITKTDKESGKKFEACLIKLNDETSKDKYATIEVPASSVTQKENGKYSVRLTPTKTYSKRICIGIEAEALVDKNGEPVIDPKTNKPYPKKEYGYRNVSGQAIVDAEKARLEAYRAAHADKYPADKAVDFDKETSGKVDFEPDTDLGEVDL